MISVRLSLRLIALGQLLLLSCCNTLPPIQSDAILSSPSFDDRVTVVAPVPATLSNAELESVVVFLAQFFEDMPLLEESLIPPHRIYYGCLSSDEAGVILNYEVGSSFEAFYPLFRDEFSRENWTYQETEIVEDELYHRMMFFKASTIRDDASVMDIQGTVLEYLPKPDRLSITVTFSHISNSINYQTFESNPSTLWILSNPKSALLGLCSDEYWTVLNP